MLFRSTGAFTVQQPQPASSVLQPPGSTGWSPKAAGLVAGLIAGVAYLGAQMAFSALLGFDGALASLQRIAAILLGPDALPRFMCWASSWRWAC